MNLIIFFISIVVTLLSTPYVYNMLLDNDCTALNYREEKIPIGMGLVFILVQCFIISITSIYIKIDRTMILFYIITVMLMGLVGMLDDLIGEKNVKGFKGHIKSLFRGKLTTGGLKAIIGFLSATLFSISISKNYLDMIVNIFLIALFTNLINLFDLRPGRAGKVFAVISITLLITSYIKSYDFIIYSALGIIIVYMRYDLKARAMMGDVGSNALGITLGAFCALTHSLNIKIVYLVILLILHIISEFYSFSKIINKSKILSFLDNLGR
ncbi:putative phospho-N-acetylmuramoyl-pentapeptide-transferase [Gottschalkia acidurici 9a]|uniref:Phospho-N-acetylmuramoyl-pentapeptide-transferase n=1 Tax=Gottschalkia acidurici (strain ATCC 7906 / DSM 604 / BCRC 14475 / CIP 104303 / KCTC 5404 / NCIMB 10678 / 9a) TaxID=1128398 RepID=K0B0J0_GOTA9|nr:phospho-N-acetylmuramoyl-pentapeptide-transferase [Gottschalkia acidurici]AFS78410.1 putative phospho-N-acetylmuramoyl-pentapeptide-transferase [Gottschalkia acidurici 9a]